MKFLKIMLVAVIIAFIVSLIVAILNYTPVSERSVDTYYFSFVEGLFWNMYFIMPVILFAGILFFFIQIILRKYNRLSNVAFISLCLILTIGITVVAVYTFQRVTSDETNDIYLIPEDYEGDVLAFYNVRGAPEVETEDGFEVHVINDGGYFTTSTPDMDYGTVTDQYFYVDDSGNRTPISEKCISMFGTGGYTTFTEGEEINLVYTGFKLTKSKCGNEFVLESYGAEEKERMIREILRRYYGGAL
ncbi:DUF6843 domain-containing protein [Oceanobacillus bengalensis]|uniref:DUF6843 domain-containing protein n=1 Tax=Oceanobacillus bengalensis TaxID=1435466 RepID=A0A494Z587_9BACI|nr:hypothetical protein [Oceanobacillus bengalensis]RKQ17635.1 hypothetical protein D8M05_04350 [Oceanobacillus bengalensis]